MFNTAIGESVVVDGVACLRTGAAGFGHAVYGPYARLDPGRYAVEFMLALDAELAAGDDVACAVLDVTADVGRQVLARSEVRRSQIGTGFTCFELVFDLAAPNTVEYRVATYGSLPLLIAGHRRLVRLAEGEDGHAALLRGRFPDPADGPMPRFFQEHRHRLWDLHAKGASVHVAGDDVVVTIEGVSFYARRLDDLRFVGEIFEAKVYDIVLAADTCVIDIGMNIGLASLRFARADTVREVHSFEPFGPTYARARANLDLNPALDAKITARNIGIAGADGTPTILMGDDDDSGRVSIYGDTEGVPHTLVVRDAGAVLGPIIAGARARGLRVIAKIDCEGAEFDIFPRLDATGLLKEIAVILIEWHRVHPDKDQRDLIAPLLRNGFAVLDRSGEPDTQFFYAFRLAG